MNISKIYLVTNCYGDPNKVYVGKTSYTKKYNIGRKNDHIRKYGKQITYTYIDEVNSLSSKDWKPLECYWIEQFKQWGFELMNKNKGGGGADFQTKESIEKGIKSRTGRKCSEETKCKMRKPHIEGTGDKISLKLKGRIYSEETILKMKLKASKRSLINFGKPITQFDREGNKIRDFKTTREASEITGVTPSNISQCLNNYKGIKTAGNYIWKFKNRNEIQ